jgi:3-oxoacyl-[acyl-carrier protein] reductase
VNLGLSGKRALITGSTSGIGEGIVRVLAAEGAAVVIHGRSRDRAEAIKADIEKQGGQAAIAVGSLPDQMSDVIDQVRQAFGTIDILVNNSGGVVDVNKSWMPWLDVPIDHWVKSYEINTLATVRLIHEFAPDMSKQGWGRIIQVGSYQALSPNTAGTPDYNASKAAMVNLTIGLSKALSKTGVNVNSICPGIIQTGPIDRWLKSIREENGWGDDVEKSIKVAMEVLPQTVNRLGQPEDIGNLVAFLCSPFSEFINGTNIHIDGGATANVS